MPQHIFLRTENLGFKFRVSIKFFLSTESIKLKLSAVAARKASESFSKRCFILVINRSNYSFSTIIMWNKIPKSSLFFWIYITTMRFNLIHFLLILIAFLNYDILTESAERFQRVLEEDMSKKKENKSEKISSTYFDPKVELLALKNMTSMLSVKEGLGGIKNL